jgi:hypothetical protein
MILAAACLLLTFLDLPGAVGRLPFLFAILLITLGLAAMLARYGKAAGTPGALSLEVGILGGIASVAGYLYWTLDYPNGRQLMNIAMGFMFGGLFIFGLVARSVKPMPRGNWLPALAGFWWLVLVLGAYVNPQAQGQGQPVPLWASLGIFALMGFFLALLGYVLQSDARR